MSASRLPLSILCLGFYSVVCAQPEPIVVGSKNFTEGYVLAEVMAQLLESRGIRIERKLGFGGTLVAFEALQAGEIDVYAEYTGTISQVILGADSTDGDLLRYRLVVLEDDRGYFPSYRALPLARLDMDPAAKAILGERADRLDDASMRALNAQVVVENRTPSEVASAFLLGQGLITTY